MFKNLRSLNVSHTLLTQRVLQMICEDLKFLEKLDISNTPIYDLSPLLLLEDRLTSLSICVRSVFVLFAMCLIWCLL